MAAASSAAAVSNLFGVVGKNVLVTGGSRGIGFMIAKGFSDHGANVVLTSRDEKACQSAAESIQCQYVASNVSTREGCKDLVSHVDKLFDGKLHVLVNNAGTSWGEPLEREVSRLG
jgi:NAD(P)-dependent dehydrogenase (short-subunit alcohol dehydrogenase family)